MQKNNSGQVCNNRNSIFDSFRGLGMISIVMVHTMKIAGGEKGVQLCFIISALLCFKSLERADNLGYEKIKDGVPWKWYFNKLLRFYPLYIISIILYISIHGFQPNLFTGEKGITLLTLISNLLFLHAFYPWHVNAININWYIGVLAIFIFLSPYLFRIIDSSKKAVKFFVLSCVLAIISSRVMPLLYEGSGKDVWDMYWGTYSFIPELPVLAIGILLYHVIFKEELPQKIMQYLSNYNIKSVFMFVSFGTIYLSLRRMYRGGTIIEWSILFLFLIFSQIICQNRILDNWFLAYIGKYSYGIYLFHGCMIAWSEAIASSYFKNEYLVPLITFVIVLSGSWVVSFFLTNCIEKPLIKKFSLNYSVGEKNSL